VALSKEPSLIIVGAGGHAREVAWLAREAIEQVMPIGFLDDDPALIARTICDLPVLGGVEDWTRYAGCGFVVAIGDPRVRRRVVVAMERSGQPRFVTLVHRSVEMSSYVTLGAGAMIAAGAILTTQVTLGAHAFVNRRATIGHDVSIGAFASVAPGAIVSGEVTIGDGAEIGAGASIRQGLSIGAGAQVGMAAAVVADIAPATLVVGIPARPVKELVPFA
jgi:sugar O-acyltransferase (sialic acid O-acetyltransferase NeuD family)